MCPTPSCVWVDAAMEYPSGTPSPTRRKRCMDNETCFEHYNIKFLNDHADEITNVQGWSDGGSRIEAEQSIFGWLLKGWTATEGPRVLAMGGVCRNAAAVSSLEVESLGLMAATQASLAILEKSWPIRNASGSGASSSRKRQRGVDTIVQFF